MHFKGRDKTKTDPGKSRTDQPSWLDMSPQDFGQDPELVQGALFPEPDRAGTPDLFS